MSAPYVGNNRNGNNTAFNSGYGMNEKKIMLIFVVGGLSFVEIAAFRCLSRDPNYPYKIILGTTKLINGTTFLQSLQHTIMNRFAGPSTHLRIQTSSTPFTIIRSSYQQIEFFLRPYRLPARSSLLNCKDGGQRGPYDPYLGYYLFLLIVESTVISIKI
eukprot:gene9326-12564_t